MTDASGVAVPGEVGCGSALRFQKRGLRGHDALLSILSVGCFFISTIFVYRSFYGMRIKSGN